MTKNTYISAIVLSIAVLSTQAPAYANIGPMTIDANVSEVNLNLVTLDVGTGLGKNSTRSSDADTILVSWSIKGAYNRTKGAVKNTGRAVKNTGRAVGRGVRAVNRVVVPSEIRRGASYTYNKAKRGAKYVYKNPYGKRCKPNKYLQPVCKVGPSRPRVQDNRRVNIRDHRRVNVRDHRRPQVQVRRR